MAWFNNNKKPKGETERSHDKRVEIVVHQNAVKEVVEEARQVNERLGKLLDENHFTLRIYLAAGSPTKKRKTT